MSTRSENTPRTAERHFEPFAVNVRIKISALWTTMLFVFAYIDIFGLFRPDVRAEIEAGQVGGFTINQSFLLGTTVYVAVPILLIFGSLVLPAKASRIANVSLSIIYALTIVAASIGEWGYYILGTVIEVALLAAIAYYAWTWPTVALPASEYADTQVSAVPS